MRNMQRRFTGDQKQGLTGARHVAIWHPTLRKLIQASLMIVFPEYSILNAVVSISFTYKLNPQFAKYFQSLLNTADKLYRVCQIFHNSLVFVYRQADTSHSLDHVTDSFPTAP